jgi:hypothetical protein
MYFKALETSRTRVINNQQGLSKEVIRRIDHINRLSEVRLHLRRLRRVKEAVFSLSVPSPS